MANETITASETAEALRIARLLRVARDAYRADKAARKEHSNARRRLRAAKALYRVASEAWLDCDVHSASIDTLWDDANAARDDLRMARHEVEVIEVERQRIKEPR